MRKLIDNDWLMLTARLLLGGVFIYASVYKIIDPTAFAKSIWNYHLAPGSLINLSAIILPWLELIVGVAVIAGFWYRGAVLWINLMLLFFLVALGSSIARGLSIDCGCFKAAASATGPAWNAFISDLGFLAASLLLLFSRSSRWMVGKTS